MTFKGRFEDLTGVLFRIAVGALCASVLIVGGLEGYRYVAGSTPDPTVAQKASRFRLLNVEELPDGLRIASVYDTVYKTNCYVVTSEDEVAVSCLVDIGMLIGGVGQ